MVIEMNKLEQLINEFCPEGVEYKALGELGEFYSGLNGKSKYLQVLRKLPKNVVCHRF